MQQLIDDGKPTGEDNPIGRCSMGFFDPLTDGMSIGPGGMSRPKRRKHRSRSRSRSSSRGRRRGESSIAGALFGDGYSKHNASRGSLFGLGNASRSSFFNFGSSGSTYSLLLQPLCRGCYS